MRGSNNPAFTNFESKVTGIETVVTLGQTFSAAEFLAAVQPLPKRRSSRSRRQPPIRLIRRRMPAIRRRRQRLRSCPRP